jgi:hypothetical protein
LHLNPFILIPEKLALLSEKAFFGRKILNNFLFEKGKKVEILLEPLKGKNCL